MSSMVSLLADQNHAKVKVVNGPGKHVLVTSFGFFTESTRLLGAVYSSGKPRAHRKIEGYSTAFCPTQCYVQWQDARLAECNRFGSHV